MALSSGEPLVLDVAEVSGQSLALDAGVPREFFARQLNLRLHGGAVSAGGQRMDRTLSLGPGAWRSLEIDLSELGSGPARLTVELVRGASGGGFGGGCALA